MANVYSVNLGYGQISGVGAVVIGPAPSGYVWVVRDIELANPLPAPFPVVLSTSPVASWYDVDAEIMYPWFFRSAAVVPSGQSITWQGRQVMPAGLALLLGDNMANWYYTVSGYQLSLP